MSSEASGSTFIAQVFLNFRRFASSKAESISRRASAGRNSTVEGDGAVVTIDVPSHPHLLRLSDNCTAERAAILALQMHYHTKWMDKVAVVLSQLAADHNIRPSEALSAEIAQMSKASASSSQPSSKRSAEQRRLSSVEQKRERTNDELVKAVLQHEARNFHEEVLPSRFLEDYQVCVALADGTLPNPDGHGFVTTGKSYAQQLVDMTENPKDWVVPFGAIVKQHPKASFPYTYTVFYKPSKTSRTMNDIMARSASFCSQPLQQPYSGTSDANVQNFVAAVGSGGGSPLRNAVTQLLSQTAPKNMLDDEGARRRGYTILPFLPPLRNAEPVDPQVVKLLRRVSAAIVPSKSGGRPAAATAHSAGAGGDAGDERSIADADDEESADVTVDSLLRQAGLTLYDVARHGAGPLAVMGRENVLEQAASFAKSDVERRRQENVLKAERDSQRREETELRLAEKRQLTLREEHTKRAAELRKEAEKSVLTLVAEKAQREIEKEQRQLAIAKQIEEYKLQAQQEMRDARLRQEAFMTKLEETLREKWTRRHLDTTLEGERTKAEALSRLAGPLSLKLNDFRPKIKQLDQEQRQAQYLHQSVQCLDTEAAAECSGFHERTSAALGQRDTYMRTVQEEAVVRSADGLSLKKKEMDLDMRVADRVKQQTLLARRQSEIPILQIARRPMTIYNTEEDPANKERSFIEWRERRRQQHEAEYAKKELGYHAKQ